MYQRAAFPKAGDPTGGQIGGLPLHHSQIQCARHLVSPLPQLLGGFFRQLQNLLGPAQQQSAVIGELQAALAPHKQLHPQFLLQTADLVTERRLAHIQFFRRPGNIPFLGNHGKIPQRTKIHSLSPFGSYHIKKIW